MSIRAYGSSVATYNTWGSLTTYLTGNSIVPTVSNGFRYECTVAGDSGEIEPSWLVEVGQTVVDGTVTWTCQDYEVAPGPLSVEIDTEGFGGYSLKDIWVKDSGSADFIVYGSSDSINWRQIDEITLPHATRDNRHKGLQNAYRYIRVSTDSSTISEIEIVAGV